MALSLICSRRGWFPFSYTRVISDGDGTSMKQLRVHKYVLGGPSCMLGKVMSQCNNQGPIKCHNVTPSSVDSLMSACVFQPPREEQQHGQPSGAGGHGGVRP